MADFKQITVAGVSHPVKDEVARQGLAGKQDKLTFDDTPTANSNNPVKSGGVYQAIQSIDVPGQISGKADKSEMSVVAGTGADADKTTITLKNGTSATVLTQHQDISGKQDVIEDLSTIRSGAAAGATAYQKPDTGIPSTDLASAVQTSLERADEAAVRPYNTQSPNGMGYLVLDKDATFASQVTTANTIYEIRYDYDLDGGSVNIPAGCTLKFEGGIVKNGTVNFNDTYIDTEKDGVFVNIIPGGTISNEVKFVDWFNVADYYMVIKILVASSGDIVFSAKTYSADILSLSDSNHIYIPSGTRILGNNATINPNYSQTLKHGFFWIEEANNISISGLHVVGINSGQATPPIGDTTYPSSNIIALYLNNNCSNISIEDCSFIDCEWGVKSSSSVLYTGSVAFRDVVINRCKFRCSIPVQGNNFIRLSLSNSIFESRGTNSGNHALYVYPKIRDMVNGEPDYLTNETHYIKIDNCVFISKVGDGTTVQIYTSLDTGDYGVRRSVYLSDCVISGPTTAFIESASVDANLSCCSLKSTTPIGSKQLGNFTCRNCDFYNIQIYNGDYYDCSFHIDNTAQFVLGIGQETFVSEFPSFYRCDIITSGYVVYNYTDGKVPKFYECHIECMGDGLVSNRQTQSDTVRFVNCSIKVKSRLVYTTSNTVTDKVLLLSCVISNVNGDSYIANIGGGTTTLQLISCIVNDAVWTQ